MKILKSVHNLVHAPLNVMESVGEMFLKATKRNDKLETAHSYKPNLAGVLPLNIGNSVTLTFMTVPCTGG